MIGNLRREADKILLSLIPKRRKAEVQSRLLNINMSKKECNCKILLFVFYPITKLHLILGKVRLGSSLKKLLKVKVYNRAFLCKERTKKSSPSFSKRISPLWIHLNQILIPSKESECVKCQAPFQLCKLNCKLNKINLKDLLV